LAKKNLVDVLRVASAYRMFVFYWILSIYVKITHEG
jgi:hypothetical protein